MARKKILFIAEAVTLAHVGRPMALANGLDPEQFDVWFACAERFEFCFSGTAFTRRTIDSISSEQFLDALAAGRPVYDERTLRDYVVEDLRLLEEVQPDLVVGDFRLSLSVSARLKKVPYIAISNAYWSPYVPQRYTVPNLPVSRLLPLGIADMLFQLARPLAFAAHTMPMNRVRKMFGLPGLGPDLRTVYTDADHTLYADIPELFPACGLSPRHSYLGAVLWSPPVAYLEWWDRLPAADPIVYVTLGSSGQERLLPLVLHALSSLPVTVIAASAGRGDIGPVPGNAFVADYLPGEEAAKRASLVICNGGSPTSQQALTAGVPVIGIAGNLDQFLNMAAIEAAGAGKRLRADRFNPSELRRAAIEITSSACFKQAALQIAQWYRYYPAGPRFLSRLNEMLGMPGR